MLVLFAEAARAGDYCGGVCLNQSLAAMTPCNTQIAVAVVLLLLALVALAVAVTPPRTSRALSGSGAPTGVANFMRERTLADVDFTVGPKLKSQWASAKAIQTAVDAQTAALVAHVKKHIKSDTTQAVLIGAFEDTADAYVYGDVLPRIFELQLLRGGLVFAVTANSMFQDGTVVSFMSESEPNARPTLVASVISLVHEFLTTSHSEPSFVRWFLHHDHWTTRAIADFHERFIDSHADGFMTADVRRKFVRQAKARYERIVRREKVRFFDETKRRKGRKMSWELFQLAMWEALPGAVDEVALQVNDLAREAALQRGANVLRRWPTGVPPPPTETPNVRAEATRWRRLGLPGRAAGLEIVRLQKRYMPAFNVAAWQRRGDSRLRYDQYTDMRRDEEVRSPTRQQRDRMEQPIEGF